MISLLPSLILLAAAFSPNVTYQIVTDEFHQHNTYAYDGVILADTPEYSIYVLNIEACEVKERLIFHNIIDETIFFNDRSPRKSSFSLQKDYDRCLLTVKKITYKNNMYYNRDLDYWYPNYNHIHIKPHHSRRRPKRANNIYRRHIITNHKSKPKVIIRHAPQKPSKPKIIIKTRHKKRHNKKRGKK